MFRTLKSKISIVYFGLVILIAVVGSVSVIALFNMSKAVDSLMIDNYKSISAVNNMLDALEKQDNSILLYINADKESGVNSFLKFNNEFLKSYFEEVNNITEPGEEHLVENVNIYYIKYNKLFYDMQKIQNNSGQNSAITFYNNTITPNFNKLKQYLKEVSALNENSMFNSKKEATKNSLKLMNFILFLSIGAVVGGFLLSRFFINRFLRPMNSLIQTVKLVKEGDLNQQTEALTHDEVGELAHEFNNMTNRLLAYDKSTIGKLMEEKNKSLAIVKSIYDPLIVMDTNYKILLLNSACESFFNTIEEKSVNMHFLEVIKNGELFDYISSTFTSKEEFKEKILSINSNGNDYYFNVIVTMVRDSNSKITSIVVTLHNVTELKKLDIVKTDFISTISHEFKTPLTSILMGTSLLSNDSLGELSIKQKSILTTINEDGERLSSLVNNLLELSRIESGKSVFNIKPASIVKIIENCMRLVNEQAKSMEVKIYFQYEDDIPKVNVDSEKISWVINNLLSNALKYTCAGDLIEINVYSKDKKVFISVKDTGTGIPEAYLEKIFDKFFQVKGQDLEVRGTGLGLAIVKEIVIVHGGEIWCESKQDIGSNFTFTLPLN